MCNVAQANTICTPTAHTIRGSSMEPLLHKDQIVISFAPTCATIISGDLVIFTTSAHKRADVIKRIVGVAGDKLNISTDNTVLINGHPVITPNNQPYIATSKGRRMLKLYIGIIPQDRYLVLGNVGSIDSSRIGLIRYSQITGVVKSKSFGFSSKLRK